MWINYSNYYKTISDIPRDKDEKYFPNFMKIVIIYFIHFYNVIKINKYFEYTTSDSLILFT